MTRTSSCTHPNGTRFTAIANYRLIDDPLCGFVRLRDKHAKRGVLIEYPDGVKIFRPNEFYDHITPLKP